MSGQKRDRIDSLDSLRFFGACAVAFFWHWQHFGTSADTYPLYSLLKPVYEYGAWMPELFFCLSGFVMFLGYSRIINQNGYNFRRYIQKRYMHIMPLMTVTLLIVTILQMNYLKNVKETFIYQGFDIYHFVLNLFCIPVGFFSNQFTFNGPAWCIGVEMLLYCIFYFLIIIKNKNLKIYHMLIIMLFSIGLICYEINCQIPIFCYKTNARGIICFIVGLMLSELYLKSPKKMYKVVIINGLIIAFLILLSAFSPIKIVGWRWLGFTLLFIPIIIILTLNVMAIKKFLCCKQFVFMGSCSLSIYLWHFPVQLILKNIEFIIDIDYTRGIVWIAYICLTLAVSIFSHILLEPFLMKHINRIFSFYGRKENGT